MGAERLSIPPFTVEESAVLSEFEMDLDELTQIIKIYSNEQTVHDVSIKDLEFLLGVGIKFEAPRLIDCRVRETVKNRFPKDTELVTPENRLGFLSQLLVKLRYHRDNISVEQQRSSQLELDLQWHTHSESV